MSEMFDVAKDWNPKQRQLREIIVKPECFDQTISLLLSMHALVHASGVYPDVSETLMDEVWDGLNEHAFRTMPTIKDVTVAWNIWHVTRIEDLTANILIAGSGQVLNDSWMSRMNTDVRDTANAMTDEEILRFSSRIDRENLLEYRNAVGRRTAEILQNLRFEDLSRRFSKEQLARIPAEGGLTEHPESIWLLDFWGKKNVAGILLMPITRHQVGHLNDCRKLKQKCSRMKK